MGPADLALLHGAAFVRPPPWSAAAFAALLADPGVRLLTALDDRAFLLGRIVAGEAEILTLATHPDARRQGHACALVLRFLDEAGQAGAACVFLEVAEDNAAARALYAGCDFHPVGRRPGYYAGAGTPPVAALVLRRELSDPAG